MLHQKWLTKSNALLISAVTSNPHNFKKTVSFKTSETGLPPLLINLPST